MDYKEMSKNLIDQIPESKMIYIVSYLLGAAVPNDTPSLEIAENIHKTVTDTAQSDTFGM